MKNRLLTILLILLTSLTFAQQKDWQWLRQFGGAYSVPQTGNDDEIIDIEVDDDGSTYVIAKVLSDFHYADTVIPFPANPGSKYVFMKFNCNGGLEWIDKYENDFLVEILKYSDSSIVVAGTHNLWLYQSDGSKTKLHDTGGGIAWRKCALDENNNIYSLVLSSLTTEYGNSGHYINSIDTTYIAKHNSQGDLLWFKPLMVSDPGGSIGLNVHFIIDANGDIVITGQTMVSNNFVTLGGDTVFATTGFAGVELFMIKLDSTGNHIWTKQTNGGGYLTGYEYDRENDHHLINTSFGTFFGGDSLIVRPNLHPCHIMVLDAGANVLFNDQYGENALASSAMGISYYEDKITFTYNCLYNVPQRIMPYGSKVTQIDSPAVLAPAFATFDTTLKDGVEDDHLHLVSPQGKSPSGRSVTYDNAGNLFMGKRTPVPITFNDSTSPFVGGGYDVFIAKWGTDTCPQPSTGINCESPHSLSVLSTSQNAATLNWNKSVNATSYIVEWGTTGFNIGSGDTIITNDTSVTINNLISNTGYEAYVNSVCSSSDSSSHIGPEHFVTSPNSLALKAKGTELKIYPNPANNQLYVNYTNNGQEPPKEVVIYNATGSVVYRGVPQNSTGTLKVNTSNWPVGMYVVHVVSKTDYTQVRKITITR